MQSDAEIKEDYCRQMFKYLNDNLSKTLKRRFTSTELMELLEAISDWQVLNYKNNLARVVTEENSKFMEELKRI